MRMTLPRLQHKAVLPILASLVLFSACSSKNPLMEEMPPPSQTKPAAPLAAQEKSVTLATVPAPSGTSTESVPAGQTPDSGNTVMKSSLPAQAFVPASKTTAVVANTEGKTMTSPPPAPITDTRAAAPAQDKIAPPPLPATDPRLNTTSTSVTSRVMNIIKPYRIEIFQGNFISKEMLEKVKPGMTREQVKFVLGTPLLADIFHANRWDYLFRIKRRDHSVATSRVTIFFDNNLVSNIRSDELPSEAEYLSRIAGDEAAKKPKKAAEPPKSEGSSIQTNADSPKLESETAPATLTPAPNTVPSAPEQTATPTTTDRETENK